jgi:hypothetical protein
MIVWAGNVTANEDLDFGGGNFRWLNTDYHKQPFVINQVELVGHYTDQQKKFVRYAYYISNYDKEFLYMLKAENGKLDPITQSACYENGVREKSFGFCQIHQPSHTAIVNDPKFFTDPYWQLDRCYELWKGGTKFYAYDRVKYNWDFRQSIQSHFNFKP